MRLDKKQTVSAQVILRPRTGGSLRDLHPVMAENVREALPAPGDVEAAAAAFRVAGFEIGGMGGGSFSITAPAGDFEKFFGTKLEAQEDGGIVCVLEDGSKNYEFPLERVPREAAAFVEAIAFTPPPDFGPTRFGP